MSTRSKVAIKKELGLVVAVYNHFDSYIEGLGKTLVEKFNSRKLAQKFVDKIADDNDYEFSLYGSEEEYCKRNENSDLNYIYLWRDDKWVYKRYPFTSEWYSVKDDLNANVNIQNISLNNESSDSCEDYKDVIERLEKRICELESDNSNLRAQIDIMRS